MSSDHDTRSIDLSRNLWNARALKNAALSWLTWLIAGIGAVPLVSVIFMLVSEGGQRIDTEALIALPPVGFELDGGFGNAILGTLVMVGIASCVSIPLGIVAAVFMALIAPQSKISKTSKFIAKTLTGFPSILAGLFTYSIMVEVWGYSAYAGGVALAVLMLPTVVLAADEAIRMVPVRMLDAAYGIGCTKTQAIFKVVLPTALPGVMTGVLLAIAGAAGESAPLLFTALFSNYYLGALDEPIASLSILIYNFSGMPFENQLQLAWAASLVLVSMVLVLNIVARFIGRKKY